MKRTTVLAAGLMAAALLLVVPGLVFANTNEPIAETGGMSATLPLMGTTLSVDVALDDVGKITTVDVNPASGMTETKTDPGYVRFATTDGKTSVSVLARGGRLALTERTTLDGLQGGGTWTADVFGTGAKSSVGYTIGKDASGNPTVTLGTIATPSGISAAADAPKSPARSNAKTKYVGSFVGATAGVTFAADGWTKHLTIAVTAKSDGTAALHITLSGRDRQKLTGTLAELVGPRTWSAHLCDGTAVSVAYHIASDGSVVFDSATGATAKTFSKNGWLWVHFQGSWVGMVARVATQKDGSSKLVVQGFSGFCPPAKSHDPKAGGRRGGHGDVGDKGGTSGHKSGGDEGWGPGWKHPS